MWICYKLTVAIYLQLFIYSIAAQQPYYYNTPANNNYDNLEQLFDILPDYKLERYILSENAPQTVNGPHDTYNFKPTFIYHLLKINNEDFNYNQNNAQSKPVMLIRHGLLCNPNTCEIDRLQITLAYLLVDQNYDVWLGTKDTNVGNQATDMAAGNKMTNKLAQYILTTTHKSELTVMNYANNSTQFYTINYVVPAVEDVHVESRGPRMWGGFKDFVRDTWTGGRDKIINTFAGIREKIHAVVGETPVISHVKDKILNGCGIVTALASDMKNHALSGALDHPDINLNAEQLIVKYGYNLEVHHVTTEDGYILTLHRISGGRKYPPNPGKRVIYLQHGILCSSACWLLTGPTLGLGFVLADEGYDVWMGNARGSTYSRAHVHKSTADSSFWNFCWHEIAIYDLPVTIDYILNLTGQRTLSYVGHSQGTTVFFVLLSERPEYNNKINKFVGLAPVAYVGNTESPLLQVVAPVGKRLRLHRVMNHFRMHEFMASNSLVTRIGRRICEARGVPHLFCTSVIAALNGYDFSRIDQTIVPVLMKHLPAGSSTKQVVHFVQEINSKKFRKFDYEGANMQVYGQSEPPNYKLYNVLVPVALFYGPNDLLANPTDVHRLSHELPNLKMNYSVPLPTFNHLDFIFAMNAEEIVNRPAINFLNSPL